MRDFRNAKAMAKTLREVLAGRSFQIRHSESLELIARVLGCKNWQVLAARIEADGSAPKLAEPPARPMNTSVLHCSFCGKTQYEVSKLIAGPNVFICDACVALCDDIVIGAQDLLDRKSSEDWRCWRRRRTPESRTHAGCST